MEWRKGGAPKDGTRILVVDKVSRSVHLVYWRTGKMGDEYDDIDRKYRWFEDGQPAWDDSSFDWWMPLPPAPEVER